MSDVSIKIEGLDELIRNFKRAPEMVGKYLQEAIYRSALLLTNYLKTGNIVPIQTGQLKQSIRPTIAKMQATISTHVPYAIFVHDGTRYMNARPFMEWAARDKTEEIQKEFNSAAEKIAQELTR